MKRSSHSGFTMIEMAIVITIIGLLAGGIVAVSNLIRGAGLKAISIETNQFRSAIQQFKNTYNALPGDMINATSYWDIAAGTTGNDATCGAAASTDVKTCNGNGNKMIAITAGSVDERYRFWQHLANAGMIQGSFTGVLTAPLIIAGSSNSGNAPGGKYDPTAVYNMAYLGPLSGNVVYFNGSYGNTLIMMGYYNGAIAGIIPPGDAYSLDTKIDDGKPGRGSVMVHYSTLRTRSGVACTNATNYADIDTTYKLTNPMQDCLLIFTNFL